jgi:hypothetical protein
LIATVGVLPPKRFESPRIVIPDTEVTSLPVAAARTRRRDVAHREAAGDPGRALAASLAFDA